jgi:uncharacterized membrane protein
MISIVSVMSKIYRVAGLVGNLATKNKNQKISKTKLTIMSVFAIPIIAAVWKVAIATSVVATIGFTSGKVFKRLRERGISC